MSWLDIAISLYIMLHTFVKLLNRVPTDNKKNHSFNLQKLASPLTSLKTYFNFSFSSVDFCFVPACLSFCRICRFSVSFCHLNSLYHPMSVLSVWVVVSERLWNRGRSWSHNILFLTRVEDTPWSITLLFVEMIYYHCSIPRYIPDRSKPSTQPHQTYFSPFW